MINLCKIFVLYLTVVDNYVYMCLSYRRKEEKKEPIIPEPKDIFYYKLGDNVTYTCEDFSNQKNFISWKQVIGNISIPFPSKTIAKYTITVQLDTFDDGSLWCCTVFKEANLNEIIRTIQFQSVERKDRETKEISFGVHKLKATAKFIDHQNNMTHQVNNGQCLPYLMENGKIVEKKLPDSIYNLCIIFIDEFSDFDEFSNCIRLARTRADEKSATDEINANLDTTTPSYLESSSERHTDPYDGHTDDYTNDNLILNMTWKIAIGIGLIFILISIIITLILIRKCRKRKKNTTPEGLYATANEVVYADLQLKEADPTILPRDNVPYAQVIGVLKKKKKTTK